LALVTEPVCGGGPACGCAPFWSAPAAEVPVPPVFAGRGTIAYADVGQPEPPSSGESDIQPRRLRGRGAGAPPFALPVAAPSGVEPALSGVEPALSGMEPAPLAVSRATTGVLAFGSGRNGFPGSMQLVLKIGDGSCSTVGSIADIAGPAP
jgi:hypothetical protein